MFIKLHVLPSGSLKRVGPVTSDHLLDGSRPGSLLGDPLSNLFFPGNVPPMNCKRGLMAEVDSSTSQDSRTSDTVDRESCSIREQDRFMPIANVIRIMRKLLPAHAKIADDAKETIQECVSEFISFITSEANDRCRREQRKTITAEDVLWAMSKLGFDDYVEPLSLYLQKYREVEGDHRGSIRGEPLPKKETSSLAMSSPGIQLAYSQFYSAGIGYYRDAMTGATIPFEPFSPYNVH